MITKDKHHENNNLKRDIMKTKRLKDLTRSQLIKLIENNQPHLQVRKNMTMQKLRDKLNILGGNFATILFGNDWIIKQKHSL